MDRIKKRGFRDTASLYMLCIYTVLIVALFVLTYVSSSLYRSFANNQDENESSRNSLSYIQAKLLSCGEKGAVKTESTDDGDILIIKEGDTGYETRIFEKDGYLIEALVRSGSEVSDGEYEKICEVSTFSVTIENNFVRISANGKTALVFLRCEGGTLK